MNAAQLVSKVSPPLDRTLAELLITEFLDIERRFVLGDWEPATLNGGQFAEVASRIVYHVDSGNLNLRKDLDHCLQYVEEEKNSNTHSFPQRRASLHLCRALRTIYKFRSQRGAVHIDPDYTANELDSTLVLALARWTMSEVLRVFWTGDVGDVASVIREIVRYDVPAVLVLDDRHLVLRTDCSVEEEILILLNNVGEKGMSRSELGRFIPKSAPSITLALQQLLSPQKRQALNRQDGSYVLTPNGSRRVRQELGPKLSLA
jgi:hypothetical protein